MSSPRAPHDDGFWWNDIDCPRCGGGGFVSEFNGKKARRVREASGLSLRAVADDLGFSAAYISDVELGRRRPNEKVVSLYKRLARETPGGAR